MTDINISDKENLKIKDEDIGELSEGTPDDSIQDKEEVYRVFKTQEEFQQCIDKALGKRLARLREQNDELNEVRPVLKTVFERFGVDSISQLSKALGDERNTPAADGKNISDAANSDSFALAEESAEALLNELENLAQTQGGVYGQADAHSLLSDKRFVSLIKNGFSAKEAFDALHFEQLFKERAEAQREQLIREIRLRGLRPDEDAVSGYGSFSAGLNPASLSEAQRADIRERVRRGERITF